MFGYRHRSKNSARTYLVSVAVIYSILMGEVRGVGLAFLRVTVVSRLLNMQIDDTTA